MILVELDTNNHSLKDQSPNKDSIFGIKELNLSPRSAPMHGEFH